MDNTSGICRCSGELSTEINSLARQSDERIVVGRQQVRHTALPYAICQLRKSLAMKQPSCIAAFA